MPDTVFDTLNALNVNEYVEQKELQNGKVKLNYLSWPWAWTQVKQRYPAASYEIIRDPVTNLPYSYDPNTGYMCYTSVTIEGITHTMWLPVMDSNNRAMKSEPYTVKTKFSEFVVAPATMFDINKTIMRCLVKNLAMFGLGLYIYAGEDLPESEYEAEPPKPSPKPKPAPKPKEPPAGQILEAPQPYVQPDVYRCEHCGQVITPYVGNNGKEVSVEKHIEASRKKLEGKIFCVNCIKDYIGGNKS
jgi:hypothetical protein